jgi:hypothetical protein
MGKIRYEHRHLVVACTLEAAEAGERAAEWGRLRETYGLGAQPLPGGARLWLRPDAQAPADDLARREGACCGFLDLEVVLEGERLHLDVTSQAPDARPVIACIAGLEPDCVLPCC